MDKSQGPRREKQQETIPLIRRNVSCLACQSFIVLTASQDSERELTFSAICAGCGHEMTVTLSWGYPTGWKHDKSSCPHDDCHPIIPIDERRP